MLTIKNGLFAAAVGIMACLSQEAQASLTLTAAASNFFATAGSTISVPIYIQESGTTHEITAGNGLVSAGFLVTHVSPGGNDDAVIGGSNLDSNGDPIGGYVANVSPTAFFKANSDSAYSDTSAKVSEDIYNPNFTGNNNAVLPTNGFVLLGYANIQAASTAGQVSSFSIGDFDSSSSNLQTVTKNRAGLDGIIAAGSFTVTATPEPGSMIMLLGATVAGMARLERRLAR